MRFRKAFGLISKTDRLFRKSTVSVFRNMCVVRFLNGKVRDKHGGFCGPVGARFPFRGCNQWVGAQAAVSVGASFIRLLSNCCQGAPLRSRRKVASLGDLSERSGEGFGHGSEEQSRV